MKTGKDTRVWHPQKSVLLNCVVGERCTIHAPVWIGNHVFLGPGCIFTNDKYPPSLDWLPTVIEDWVSIGAGSVILPGITIHAHAMVGAGSVVTKDVPIGAVVVGNPARIIRQKAVA